MGDQPGDVVGGAGMTLLAVVAGHERRVEMLGAAERCLVGKKKLATGHLRASSFRRVRHIGTWRSNVDRTDTVPDTYRDMRPGHTSIAPPGRLGGRGIGPCSTPGVRSKLAGG